MVSTETAQAIPRTPLRWGLWLLVLAGIIPALIFTLWMTTPDPGTDQQRLAAMATGPLGLGTSFVYIVALIALLLGLQALYGALAGGPTAGSALVGLIGGIASVALLIAGLSTAGLGQATVADLYLSGQTGVGAALTSFSGGSFGRPITTTLIAAVVLAIIGAIAYGVAIWRSASFPRWTAIPFGLGFVLVATSFPFGTQLGGILLAIAGAALARALARESAVAYPASADYQGMARSSK